RAGPAGFGARARRLGAGACQGGRHRRSAVGLYRAPASQCQQAGAHQSRQCAAGRSRRRRAGAPRSRGRARRHRRCACRHRQTAGDSAAAGGGLGEQSRGARGGARRRAQVRRRHGARARPMIRVVTFLLAVAVLAAGFAWLADRPGEVAVTWLGYRLETSVLVTGLALIVLVIALMLAIAFVRGILRSPEQVSLFFRHRRAVKGYLALSRGLIAIGAGDLKLARRSASDAARLAPGDPLTLLLIAQSAQMAGDRAGAERAFRDMTRRDDTKLLGLRGLYIEAQRRNDTHGARLFAEEAAKTAPGLAWAGQAVLDDRCAASDWAGALAAVLEAVKLAPDLVPAAALAGRRLAESNDWRKARKILEAAWTANPHPDIAEAYGNLRFGDSARERLMRMQKLAAKVEGQREGALAVARAAIDAREFKIARDALAPHLAAPTRRVATLMAEIEEAEHGDTGRVREWVSRAVRAAPDPVGTADGVVSERWLPVTPNGRLDGFEWKLPLAELGASRRVIEVTPP